MEVKMMDLSVLKPYKDNPRKISDEAVEKVANSIREFGFQQPIVVDKDFVIIVGHTRLKAAKELGLTKVPVIVADTLTEEQAKAYRLADNKTGEFSLWDNELLDSELDDLLAVDFDMEQFGFEFDDVDPEIEEDDFDCDLEEGTDIQKGDIYQLGEHRLMCGDSTEAASVNMLMNGAVADMLFTDPPYGYEYQSNMREKSDKFDVIENDDKILDFFPAVISQVDGFMFICTTWKVLDKWLPLFTSYRKLTNMVIWDKGGGGIGDLTHTFSTDYEIMLICHNDHEITGKRIGSVWKVHKDDANDYVHPTQKPVGLSAMAIRNTTTRGDIVLDVFGGSGSTMIACEQLGRKCYMMELDPHYCQVIIDRWEHLTGHKAVKVEA